MRKCQLDVGQPQICDADQEGVPIESTTFYITSFHQQEAPLRTVRKHSRTPELATNYVAILQISCLIYFKTRQIHSQQQP